MVEIVIPELHEMRTAHVVSIGSETLCSLNPDCEDGSVSFSSSPFLSYSFLNIDYVFIGKAQD